MIMMEVMTLHEWFDDDVVSVRMDNEDVLEIGLLESNEGALLINEADVIALAKEFGLVVYHKSASL